MLVIKTALLRISVYDLEHMSSDFLINDTTSSSVGRERHERDAAVIAASEHVAQQDIVRLDMRLDRTHGGVVPALDAPVNFKT